jgi:aspartyl-tRNA(Asn)/glutamyl-tRNA(Gln) amidotransferase subunit C
MDTATIQHIATLARLRVEPAEQAQLASELTQVLALFDQLRDAPVDELAPLSHPGDVSLRLRPDLVTEGDVRAAFEAIAPSMSGGYYLVPKVIE